MTNEPCDLVQEAAKEIDQLRINAYHAKLGKPPDRMMLLINIMFNEELTGMKAREKDAARKRVIGRLTGFDSLRDMKAHSPMTLMALWHWLQPYYIEQTKHWRMNEKKAGIVREIWRIIRGDQSQETTTTVA